MRRDRPHGEVVFTDVLTGENEGVDDVKGRTSSLTFALRKKAVFLV